MWFVFFIKPRRNPLICSLPSFNFTPAAAAAASTFVGCPRTLHNRAWTSDTTKYLWYLRQGSLIIKGRTTKLELDWDNLCVVQRVYKTMAAQYDDG